MMRTAWPRLFVFYVLATFLVLWPLTAYEAIDTASYPGDPRLNIWTLAWQNHAVLDGTATVFDANAFYPARDSLAFSEHLLGIGLFTLPLYAATGNPVLAYTVVWWLSFLASALAAHWLVWRIVRDHLVSAVAGCAYAFCFFKMLHGHGHLPLVWAFWLPLIVVFGERWWQRRGWPQALCLATVLLLQILASWYVAVLAVLLVVGVVAWQAGLEIAGWQPPGGVDSRPPPGRPKTRTTVQALAIFLIAIGPALLLARHYAGRFPADPAETIRYSASLVDYLRPPQDTWVGLALLGSGLASELPWSFGERTLSIGLVWLLLAAGGVVSAIRGGRHAATVLQFAALTAVGVVLSLGPGDGWDGGLGLWPFSWLAQVPGAGGFRVPARFALLAALGVAVLAALGAGALRARWPRASRAVIVVLIALGLSESFLVTFPLGKPPRVPVPPVYRFLASLPPGPVVSLPSYRHTPERWRAADYQYFSTAHWRPIVNGYSRFEPPDHSWIMGHMSAFAGPNSARTMRQLGVRYVVFHAGRAAASAEAILSEAAAGGDYRQIVRMGDDYLFEVVPTADPGDGTPTDPPRGR